MINKGKRAFPRSPKWTKALKHALKVVLKAPPNHSLHMAQKLPMTVRTVTPSQCAWVDIYPANCKTCDSWISEGRSRVSGY